MTFQCCRRTERQFCVPRQEVCFHLSRLGQLPRSTLSSRDKREQSWMSDWDQSGRLFQSVGESFPNSDCAFLFWEDLPHCFLEIPSNAKVTLALCVLWRCQDWPIPASVLLYIQVQRLETGLGGSLELASPYFVSTNRFLTQTPDLLQRQKHVKVSLNLLLNHPKGRFYTLLVLNFDLFPPA